MVNAAASVETQHRLRPRPDFPPLIEALAAAIDALGDGDEGGFVCACGIGQFVAAVLRPELRRRHRRMAGFRQQVRLRVRGPDVLKFLLQNELFPRSTVFCLKQLETRLSDLPRNSAAKAAIASLKQQLCDAALPELANEGLHGFIDHLQIGFGEIHDQIAATYFSH